MNDVKDFRPQAIDEMVGQHGVVEQVRVGLKAAKMDDTAYPHTLAVGPAGVGKTQLAHLIADSMNTSFSETLGESLSNAAQLNQFLLAGTQVDRAVLVIDEAHSIPKPQQTRLLIALSENKLVYEGHKGPQSIPLGRFTLIMASTEQWSLLGPLISRLRVLNFDYYSPLELTTLLDRRVKGLGWAVEAGVLTDIAKRGRGVPRHALNLLASARMVARSEGHKTIRIDDANRAFALEGVDELGLGPVERAYLDRLSSGPSRLNVVASVLGLPSRTVQGIESTLIRFDLITKTNSGTRELTRAGRDHLATNRPVSASIV